MCGRLGMNELLVIGLVFAVLFGATRLPEIGRGLGLGIGNFKRSLRQLRNDDDDDEHEEEKP